MGHRDLATAEDGGSAGVGVVATEGLDAGTGFLEFQFTRAIFQDAKVARSRVVPTDIEDRGGVGHAVGYLGVGMGSGAYQPVDCFRLAIHVEGGDRTGRGTSDSRQRHIHVVVDLIHIVGGEIERSGFVRAPTIFLWAGVGVGATQLQGGTGLNERIATHCMDKRRTFFGEDHRAGDHPDVAGWIVQIARPSGRSGALFQVGHGVAAVDDTTKLGVIGGSKGQRKRGGHAVANRASSSEVADGF